jgi:hypothetical protein
MPSSAAPRAAWAGASSRPRDLTVGPLSIGGMIDRAIAAARASFRPLFLAMLLLQAPALAMARFLSAQAPAFLLTSGDPRLAAERAPVAMAAAGGLLVVLFLLQAVATTVAAALLAPALAPNLTAEGERLAVAPSWPRRLLGAIGAGLAQQLLLGLAMALGALPGLLVALTSSSAPTTLVGAVGAMVGGLVLFLVALLRTILAPVVVAVEGLGPWGALRRSVRLMGPRPGQPVLERPGVRASVLLFTTFVLLLAVNGLAGLPRALASGFGGGGILPFLPGALPLPVELGRSLFELVAGAALQPFSLAVIVVFYFERRARTEGLDLAAWATRLELAPRGAP